MKAKRLWGLGFGLVFGCLTVFSVVAADPSATTLTWRMAVLVTTSGKLQSVPFSRPLSMTDGQRFQLLVTTVEKGFVDVLYEDTTGAVQPLFHGPVTAGQVLTLPSEGKTFQVTPPNGTEKLHVVVSVRPQAKLEKDITGLPASSSTVLDDLTALKTSLVSIAEAPEKPVPMGGVTRGLEDAKITEFRGAETYAKTIRFDH